MASNVFTCFMPTLCAHKLMMTFKIMCPSQYSQWLWKVLIRWPKIIGTKLWDSKYTNSVSDVRQNKYPPTKHIHGHLFGKYLFVNIQKHWITKMSHPMWGGFLVFVITIGSMYLKKSNNCWIYFLIFKFK
jgi:hypothetical protein